MSKIIVANWKMNGSKAFIDTFFQNFTLQSPHQIVFCPPFPYLDTVNSHLKESHCILGAQDCHPLNTGAFTGDVSAEMLKDMGCQYVILGHSERREYYGETSEILNKKVALALANGLTPIYCCGEALDIRQAEKQNDFVKTQLEETIFNLSAEDFSKLVIAYEPIWAIGTGVTASTAQAQEMLAFIRSLIAAKFGKQVAEETSILYGGSCNAKNAPELFAQADIDGGLIGGASLKAEDFLAIITAY